MEGVGIEQLIRFLVVELIHPVLNLRFDMSVAFTANYSFSVETMSPSTVMRSW
jgi:hypothetical protein